MFLMRTLIHFWQGWSMGSGQEKQLISSLNDWGSYPVLILLECAVHVEKRIGCWYANVWQLFWQMIMDCQVSDSFPSFFFSSSLVGCPSRHASMRAFITAWSQSFCFLRNMSKYFVSEAGQRQFYFSATITKLKTQSNGCVNPAPGQWVRIGNLLYFIWAEFFHNHNT